MERTIPDFKLGMRESKGLLADIKTLKEEASRFDFRQRTLTQPVKRIEEKEHIHSPKLGDYEWLESVKDGMHSQENTNDFKKQLR